jgi:hypothetical protein
VVFWRGRGRGRGRRRRRRRRRRRKGSSSNSSTHKQLSKQFTTLFKNVHPTHNAKLK